MIKKIALAAVFALVSSFSIGTATAVSGSQPAKKISAPAAPAPQGICFPGSRSC